MKRYLCLLVLLCLFFKLPAQERPQALSIGDKLPGITISNILNHPAGETNLATYRGQWLILDFFATWCSPCIAMFPKADSLEAAFGGKVQFLSITYETASEVNRLFSKIDVLEGISPPIVVKDSVLHALFPHRTVPHYVWIDPEGEVAAITGLEEITVGNIRSLLGKNETSMGTKRDVIVPYSRDELLLAGNKSLPKKVLYQSAFMEYIDGLPGSHTIFPVDSVKGLRVLATNANLPRLYKIAYGLLEGTYFPRNRILLEVADTTRLTSPLTGKEYVEWKKQGNSFCYELLLPPALVGQAAEIMQQDMLCMFPQYRAHIASRDQTVLALVRTSAKRRLKSKGGKSILNFTPYEAKIQNHYLSNLVLRLNALYLQHFSNPLVDRTGLTERVDLTLEANLSDVASIKRALQEYGLDLVPRTEKIKVLTISDASTNDRTKGTPAQIKIKQTKN